MVDVVTIGQATLYFGDCLEILPTLDKVAAVVTDPPYKLTSGGNTESGINIAGYNNSGVIVPCDIEWSEIMDAVYGALMNDGDAYVMANDKNLIKAGEEARRAGFGLHNILVWDKVGPVPNRWYMKNCEYTLYLWKGKAATINDPSSQQLYRCPRTRGTEHPTEKPVALMRHYIENSTAPGDTVLDPFLGSGTTGVAALQSGRKFVGIELERKYFDIACERIERANDQPQLFTEQTPAPVQSGLEL